MPTDYLLSRRQFAATGLAGVGLTLAAAGASQTSTSALPVSLRNEAELLRIFARLHGDLSGRATYGWFDGPILAVAPGGITESFGSLHGIIARRLRPLAGEDGWQIQQREISAVYGLPVEREGARFINPISGRIVAPPPPAVRTTLWSLNMKSTVGLTWFSDADRTIVETPFRVAQRALLGSVSESLTLHFEGYPNENHSGDAIASLGTLLRMEPSPAWLGMEGNPGHMLYRCRFVGGLAALAAAPIALRRALNAPDSLASLHFDRETELD